MPGVYDEMSDALLPDYPGGTVAAALAARPAAHAPWRPRASPSTSRVVALRLPRLEELPAPEPDLRPHPTDTGRLTQTSYGAPPALFVPPDRPTVGSPDITQRSSGICIPSCEPFRDLCLNASAHISRTQPPPCGNCRVVCNLSPIVQARCDASPLMICIRLGVRRTPGSREGTYGHHEGAAARHPRNAWERTRPLASRRVPGVTPLACEAKSRAALPPAEMMPPPGAAMDPSSIPALAIPRSVSHLVFRSMDSLPSTNSGASHLALPERAAARTRRVQRSRRHLTAPSRSGATSTSGALSVALHFTNQQAPNKGFKLTVAAWLNRAAPAA